MSLKPQKAHYEVNIWFERDRASIVVSNINGKTIAEWWDEDVLSMFEDGFFISGKGKDKLAKSVLDYLQDRGVIKAKTFTYSVV
jgi:hypothetical protein